MLFFAYNLWKFVEVTLESCSDIVGNSNPLSLVKKSSLKDDIISATRFLGLGLKVDGLSDIVANGFESYQSAVLEMKKSKLAWFIYEYYCDRENQLRSEIIKAAIDIFAHYEPQFKHVSLDGSCKKAMQILAFESSFRFFSHLKNLDIIQLDREKKINKDLIVKCIINAKGKTLNYGVTYKKNVIRCVQLFDEVGIFSNSTSGNIYYKNSNSNLLGYRKKFAFEELNKAHHYPEDDDEYCRQFYLLCYEELMKSLEVKIENYIIEKNPDEFRKQQSHQFHREQMNDRKNKHDELMNYLKIDIHDKLQKVLRP